VNDAVTGDIDGDGDPDLVTAADDGFAYHLNADRRFGPAVLFGRPRRGDAGSVAVGDADRDGDLDIYGMATDHKRSNPADAVWINNNLAFTRVPVPSAAGLGNEVTAVRPRAGGRSEFLVLNGFGKARGPNQLIRLVA
jgi:hypothetical protein